MIKQATYRNLWGLTLCNESLHILPNTRDHPFDPFCQESDGFHAVRDWSLIHLGFKWISPKLFVGKLI